MNVTNRAITSSADCSRSARKNTERLSIIEMPGRFVNTDNALAQRILCGNGKVARARTPLGLFSIASDHRRFVRSEEHTSELQSRFDLVCRLLLEKKKK